jgi:probable phosphoglycerate mutase
VIVLVRHGEAQGAAGRAVGQVDLPLSVRGREQASALAAGLGGIAWAALYSSPLARARDTLAPLAAAAGRAPAILDGLAEISLGAWEGLAWSDIRARFPAEHAARGRDLAGYRPPGGESFADLAARAGAVLDELAAGPLPVLAVTHAGVVRVLLARFLGLTLRDIFRLSPQEGRGAALAPHAGGLRLVGFNLSPSDLADLVG